MARSVRDATFDVFREYGLTTLFANPGSTEISFLTDLPGDLQFVLGLHESSVVGMATGWAIGRGEPGLAILHTTPGLGNAVSAIATARVNRAPLVVIVGQQDRRHLATEPFLAGRLQGLAGDYPVWVDQPIRAQDVPGAIARAHHESVTGRGPAVVIVPMDDWSAEATEPGERAAPRRVVRAPAADGATVAELVELLAGAESPVLVVGAGADDPETWVALVASPSGSAAPSGKSRSAPARDSRRTTCCSPVISRQTGCGCVRRSHRTISCSRWAHRCSGSIRSSRARSSSRGPASR